MWGYQALSHSSPHTFLWASHSSPHKKMILTSSNQDLMIGYGSMEIYDQSEPKSNTASGIVIAYIAFLLITFGSMYGTVYVICPGNEEQATLAFLGGISALTSIGCIVLFWKYRGEEARSLFLDRYWTLFADTVCSVSIVLISYQVVPSICYQDYYSLVQAFYFSRASFALTLLVACSVVCLKTSCSKENQSEHVLTDVV